MELFWSGKLPPNAFSSSREAPHFLAYNVDILVVRFGSRLAHWIAARVAEVVALVNAPDMHICGHVRRVVAPPKDITALPEESV